MTYDNNKIVFLKNLLIGFLVTVAATAAVMAIFAVVMCYISIDLLYSGTFSSVSLGIGGLTGGYFFTKLQGKNGMMCGALLGATVFLILTIVSLIVDKSGVSIITLIHAVITIVSSAMGGILAVNTQNKRKY